MSILERNRTKTKENIFIGGLFIGGFCWGATFMTILIFGALWFGGVI